jgi:hypothetical protein
MLNRKSDDCLGLSSYESFYSVQHIKLTCIYVFFPGQHACVPLQVDRKNTETVSDSKKKIVYLLVICDLSAGHQHCLIGFVAVVLGVYLNPRSVFPRSCLTALTLCPPLFPA